MKIKSWRQKLSLWTAATVHAPYSGGVWFHSFNYTPKRQWKDKATLLLAQPDSSEMELSQSIEWVSNELKYPHNSYANLSTPHSPAPVIQGILWMNLPSLPSSYSIGTTVACSQGYDSFCCACVGHIHRNQDCWRPAIKMSRGSRIQDYIPYHTTLTILRRAPLIGSRLWTRFSPFNWNFTHK